MEQSPPQGMGCDLPDHATDLSSLQFLLSQCQLYNVYRMNAEDHYTQEQINLKSAHVALVHFKSFSMKSNPSQETGIIGRTFLNSICKEF